MDGSEGGISVIATDGTNSELRMLWKEVIDSGTWPEADIPKLWPLEYQTGISTPTLVFVGMNPAYAKREPREKPITNTDVLLDPKGRTELCEDTRSPSSPYFRPFDWFVEKTSLPGWTHLDIFAVRHTDQSAVKRALGLDGQWTDFAIRQFMIFKGLLEQIDPPVIVVPNAFASRILSNALEAGEMSPEHGCHFLKLNGRQIPAFLSGMLTGQRAMDVYSRDRLIYQARKMIVSLGYEAAHNT